ncbi:MAG: 4-hydroxy-tetrahydrodipicolinate synthase [Actinobacteria bacterium]|nr:4-hydroxy-tetrahydrodipicolinate synthase [Actinomycetota bacterium]
MSQFGQVLTAMVTPFKKDKSVDYEKAAELALYLIKNGSDGVVVSGTTGESPTLSKEEKIELFRIVKSTVGRKGKVIAGTGNYCTSESIELTKEAEKTGVDGCMLVAPYYNKPPQKGLINHFKAIAGSTSLPVILYNVPSRTSCNIESSTVITLSKIKNIVAVKEASGNMEQISKIAAETGNSFYVYSGDDSLTLPILALGGCGVISVASHFVGKDIQKMINAYKKGLYKKAAEIHFRLLPLFKELFVMTNPIMVKAGLNLIGLNVGGLRLPLVEANKDEVVGLKEIIKKLEIM